MNSRKRAASSGQKDSWQTVTRRAAIVVIFALCALGAGCGASNRADEKRYELKGKVVSIDKRGATVTIAHDEIPGYMEAMTMPFMLKDEYLLDQMAAGDRVTATLVVEGDRSRLEAVVFTREEVDASAAGKTASAIEPSPGDEVPGFSLINQNAKRINLREYRGRALVLTFIYTRCPLPDYCPLMTERFEEIDKSLATDPLLYERTQLLSVTVDPEYDTPNVLRNYGMDRTTASGESDFNHWQFATGSKDEIKKIAQYFGLEYWTEADQIIHSLRTAIVSPDGKIVRIYRGNDWQPSEILSELRSLKLD